MSLEQIAEGDLLFKIENNIGLITLNRPESRNALTFDMYAQLMELCTAISESSDISALIIYGAGNKAFAAGTDISGFLDFSTDAHALEYEQKMDEVLCALERVPIPTIAAITGACTGGGAAIAAACDIRYCDEKLKYGFPIAKTLGNCLSAKNLSRQIWLLGASRVKEIMLTARLVGADEARQTGLIAEVNDNPLRKALEVATALKSHAPLTMAATKETMRRLRVSIEDVEDRDFIIQCYTSEDFREGMDAFLAKRLPHWKGR